MSGDKMKTPEELADEYTINVYDCLDDSLSKIKTMRVSKYAFLAGYKAATQQCKDRIKELETELDNWQHAATHGDEGL